VKITELSPQKNNPSRFNLFVDEQFFLGVSATGVAKYNLYKGKDIDQSTLDEIVIQEIYQRFLDRTVEYLSRTVKTERDVRRYLRQLNFKKKGKWFDENIVLDWDSLYERVIEQLRKYKYIDDQRFAQLFLESRAKSKPRSTSFIVSELVSKGVDRKIAQEIVGSSEVSNEDLIVKVYSKKFKQQPLDLMDRKKVDFLRRKGFNWDEISKLADRLKNDASE
jgi:regulatory protein